MPNGESRLLNEGDGGGALQEMGADETGAIWVLWRQHWLPTGLNIDPTTRPATLTRLKKRSNVECQVSQHETRLELQASSPSVTPFGVIDPEKTDPREWAPDSKGRFTQWRDAEPVNSAGPYHPGFRFDRIDRRVGGRLAMEALQYVNGEEVVGLYFHKLYRQDGIAGAAFAAHAVGWVENGRMVRLDYRPILDHDTLGPQKTIVGIAIKKDDFLATTREDRASPHWLDSNPFALGQFIYDLTQR